MPSFQADTGALASIASRLTSVVDSLNDEAHSSFDTASLGYPDAISALESFVKGWSHGRSEIQSGVNTIQAILQRAAGTYNEAESDTINSTSAGAA